ncbi:MAG: ribose-phosphate diphosphokinase [Candidatus Helarchaeota archaeon]
MIIIPGPTAIELGKEVSNLIENSKIIEVLYKQFPDGEDYIQIQGNVENDNVLVIQTTFPEQDKCLMQLFLMLEAISEMNPKSISIVIPYFAYSRQDKRFKPGEALSAKVISTTIKTLAGNLLDKVITFDIHSEIILDFFEGKAKNISAMELFGHYFKKLNVKNVFCLAPDKTATPRAEKIARILDCEYSYLEKIRDLTTGEVTTKVKDLNVGNKNVIIADDIISTGGTMIKAIKMLKSQGANDIYVCATHALLIGDSKSNIFKAGAKEIIGTNTIQNEYSKVSIASLIAKEFNNIP